MHDPNGDASEEVGEKVVSPVVRRQPTNDGDEGDNSLPEHLLRGQRRLVVQRNLAHAFIHGTFTASLIGKATVKFFLDLGFILSKNLIHGRSGLSGEIEKKWVVRVSHGGVLKVLHGGQ